MSVVNRIENIFEEMNEERRRLNDFLDEIKFWKDFLPRSWFNIIKTKLVEFDAEELRLKLQLAQVLVEIRSGTTEESKMIELIDDFDAHSCSPTSIERFLHDNRKIERKIKTLSRISSDKNCLLKQITSINDFIKGFYDNDVYLLNISDQWEIEDDENSFKQMRYFKNLKKVEEETENSKAKFWVIDYDLHGHLENDLDRSVIFYAARSKIKSRDFHRDSLSKTDCGVFHWSITKTSFQVNCHVDKSN